MNDYYKNDKPSCYFHPKEVVIGVCRLCLTERLLILAAKQRHLPSSKTTQSFILRKPPISFPKIFAFGSFLNRLEFRHSKTDNSDDHDASTSPEDSFISIKFEDNGAASWEKNKVNNKVSLEHCNMAWNNTMMCKRSKETKSVVEHTKPHSSLRWRKRIGHLLQLIRWRRSNKANVCHVGNNKVVEGVKVRKGWIRTLTKRRTKE